MDRYVRIEISSIFTKQKVVSLRAEMKNSVGT